MSEQREPETLTGYETTMPWAAETRREGSQLTLADADAPASRTEPQSGDEYIL